MIINARLLAGRGQGRMDRVISLTCVQGTKVEGKAVALMMFVFVS